MPAKKSNATKEFKVPTSKSTGTKKSSSVQTSAAYRTARIARARQKREIEQQKREKFVFAMFVVMILVLLLIAVLVFKNVLGNDTPVSDTYTGDVGNTDVPDETEPPTESYAQTDYTVTVEKSAVKSGSLVLVNDSKPYVSSAPTTLNMSESRTPFYSETKQKNLYSYYVASIYNTALEETALKAFNEMTDAFYNATGNIDLYVSRAYSESGVHATGLALDLTIWTGGDNFYPLDDKDFASVYSWLFDNYYKYGFIIDESADHSFCFRYVGVPHAYYMHKHAMGLEDYLKLVCKESLAFTTSSGDKYEISYVHATGDMVSISLPSADAEYEISGDNNEGLIVSVKMN